MTSRYLDTYEQQYELDMKVATALGWTDISRRYGYPPGENGPHQVPFYSSDEQSALSALQSLKLGWHLIYTPDFTERYDLGYSCVLLTHGQVLICYAQGSTLAEAICKAIIDWDAGRKTHA